jgi:hypothetical protein
MARFTARLQTPQEIEAEMEQNKIDRHETYIRNQFKKLVATKYGYSIKIFDGLGNTTNQMELTPQKAELIQKILKEE